MTLFKWLWPCKMDDKSYFAGFDKGFEAGIRMASKLDEKVRKQLFDEANEAALRRINGSNS